MDVSPNNKKAKVFKRGYFEKLDKASNSGLRQQQWKWFPIPGPDIL